MSLIKISVAASIIAVANAAAIIGQGEFIHNSPSVDIPINNTYANNGAYKYAVFLSNDGMHQFDYKKYIAQFPSSTLATLSKNGVVYTNAKASSPSDSYPATAAIVAGCSSRTHGLYWDDSYSRDLYAPGSDCQGDIGTEVDLSSGPDANSKLLTGGGGFNTSLLTLRKTAWGTCVPVLPHNYIRTNTMFEVARQNGLATAYADKISPSGLGLSEGYFPELASIATTDVAQEGWDALHWSALKNWVNGMDVQGNKTDYKLKLFGANFQSLTNAQSRVSYLDSNGTPSSNITEVLRNFDTKLSEFVQELKNNNMWEETLLVIGSKQGQGPVNPKDLIVVHPDVLTTAASVPVNYITSADWGLLYLNKSSDAATAKKNLLAAAASNFTQNQIVEVLAGDEIWEYGWGNPALDPRAPDVLIKGSTNTLYRAAANSFEDHGGAYAADVNVPLIVTSGRPLSKAGEYDVEVQNMQIAPTLLQALGLPLWQLDGARIEGTPVLPYVF